VIGTDQVYERWRPLLSGLQTDPIAVAGVHLYRLLARNPNAPIPTLLAMRTDFDTRRFESVITGVQNYLMHGGSIDTLSARDSLQLGIITTNSLIGPPEPYSFLRDPQHNWFRSPQFRYGMALFTTGDNEIAVGEAAWAPAIKGLLAKYRPIANLSEIDLPKDNAFGATPAYTLGRFVMVFDRQRLERAATLASSLEDGTKVAQIGYLKGSSGDASSQQNVQISLRSR